VKFLDGQMAVALGKKQIAERNALSGRPQAGAAQPGFDRDFGFFRHSGSSGFLISVILD
jgi:hypothetical protein